MRVLHVIIAGGAPRLRSDPLRLTRPERADPELAYPATAALIEHSGSIEGPGVEHVTILIGPSSQRARAAARGLRVHACIPLTRSTPRLLARWISASGGFDAAHTWSVNAARLAAGAIARSERQESAHNRGGSLDSPGLTSAASRVTLYQLDNPGCAMPSARPGAPVRIVNMSAAPAPRLWAMPSHDQRAEARDHLGFPSGMRVAALLGDSADCSDVMRFFSSLALVNRTGRAVAGIAHEGAGQALRAVSMHQRTRESWPLLVADHPPSLMLACADIAIYTGGRDSDSGARSASWEAQETWTHAAHQAGVSVVVARHPWDSHPPASGVIRALAATPTELARVLVTSWGTLHPSETAVPARGDDFARQCLALWTLARPTARCTAMESVA